MMLPLAGGPAVPIAGLPAFDYPTQWTVDGKGLYVRRAPHADRANGYLSAEPPALLLELDLASGKETPFRELAPADPSGVAHIDNVFLTPDGKSYVYSYYRITSELYIVSGLK
jgi:hypothetical protein